MSAALLAILGLLVICGPLDSVEIFISDHGGKRPRRSHRIITRRVYHRPRPTVYHVHYYHRLPYPRSVS